MIKLYAPADYMRLTGLQRQAICNGCGAKGWGVLVPDRLLGASVRECCNIHDFMYSRGSDITDKDAADRVFLNNMLRVIDHGHPWLRWPRRRLAMLYTAACGTWAGRLFGRVKTTQ